MTRILTAFALAPVLCLAQGYVTTGAAPASSFDIFGPGVVAVDAGGNVYAAVRDGVIRIDPSGARARVAGTEREWRYSGDGGPAMLARLNPRAVAMDAARNLYLADAGNNRIRRVDAATGVITTVAGNGEKGFSGDGGPAADARLDGPSGVAVDGADNIYIADGTTDGHDRIRKIAAAGIITTVAGNGSEGYAGDGGPATLAQFRSLGGLAADAAGNLYIADNFNNRIRMVSAATGIVTTVAGNGEGGAAGDGGPATGAELNNPLSVALDAAGNLYIADSGNSRIRKVAAATRRISTPAGSGRAVYPDTKHGYPCALAVDAAGNLYIADSGASRIRRVPAEIAEQTADPAEVAATPTLRSLASGSGFRINATYDNSVPAAAQAAFNSLVSVYETTFTTNVTVNVNVRFGNVGLGESNTEYYVESYSDWRAAMMANASANPGNTYAAAAAASLPASDPIGNSNVFVSTANARALGFTANAAVDTTITLSNAVTYEYTGKATPNAYDFMDAATHELDEGLCIGSALTGLANNAPVPSSLFEPEDYFRYSAPGTRDITTNPSAVVYFSYDGGNTNVAQFNQAYSALNDNNLDRNDWIYGNAGCPAATPHIQDAIECSGQAEPIGQAGSPEAIVLNALGYNSGVSLTPQTIAFNLPATVTAGTSFSISATASSGLPVTFASATPTVCTVSGTTVMATAPGTCSIFASQAGSSVYAPASVTQSLTVTASTQQILFPSLPNVSYGVAPFALTATASSGLPVSFSSSTSQVCQVSGSTVTIVGVGTCTITASQAGNSVYAPASATQSFTVMQEAQQIQFSSLPNVSLGAAPFVLTATASSRLPVSFSSSTTAVCTVSGSTVTIVGIGTCTITASQAGNSVYSPVSVTQSFTVVHESAQQILFSSLPNVSFGAAPFTLTAAASSGLPVSFSSSTNAVCAVSGSAVTILGAGTCTITASQAGNSVYSPVSATQSFMVLPGSQQILFPALPNVSFGAAPFALTATASSGLPVSFSSSTNAVCTVSGSTVTIVGGGTCTIVASQAGSANFSAATPVTQSFTVGPGGPVINAGGVVPIYSSATTIQAGSWISIFGSNLASAPTTWNNNFPTMLGGTSVTIDGKLAYLWYVSPTQINLQAPDDSVTGSVNVVVTTGGGSTTSTVTLAPISPSFSLLDGVHVAGIILRSGGAYDIIGPTGTSLGYPTVAAKAGDSVVLFGVGFGPTSPTVLAGQAYTGAAATTNPVQLKINGTTVIPSFAGESSAGLYQINVAIPAGLGTGDQTLVATVGGTQTQAGVLISLQ